MEFFPFKDVTIFYCMHMHTLFIHSYNNQFSSVTQLYPSLCDPMDCSTPGFPVHHQLPELLKLMSIESVMPSNHLILCCPLLLLPSTFPASGSGMSQLFASGVQSIGVSASTSVLPMNIQDWFSLGWTGWISLQPKGLSSNTRHSPIPQFKSINSSALSFHYSPTLTSIHDYWKKHSFD